MAKSNIKIAREVEAKEIWKLIELQGDNKTDLAKEIIELGTDIIDFKVVDLREWKNELSATSTPTLNITDLEREVLIQIPEDDFYEDGLDSCLWTDVFLDNLTIGAKKGRGVLTSLIKKDLISISEPDTSREGNPTYFTLTESGKNILSTVLSKEETKMANKTKVVKADTKVVKADTKTEVTEETVIIEPTETKTDKKVEKTVDMHMFTGLFIATFPIESETKTTISVMTQYKGLLTFNKKDGKQTGLPANKVKYGNYLIIK